MNIEEKITYKRGWKFVRSGNDILVITATDASSGRGLMRINRRIHGGAHLPDVELAARIFEEILWIENHERAEFFKVCGRQIIDPHPELRQPKPAKFVQLQLAV